MNFLFGFVIFGFDSISNNNSPSGTKFSKSPKFGVKVKKKLVFRFETFLFFAEKEKRFGEERLAAEKMKAELERLNVQNIEAQVRTEKILEENLKTFCSAKNQKFNRRYETTRTRQRTSRRTEQTSKQKRIDDETRRFDEESLFFFFPRAIGLKN